GAGAVLACSNHGDRHAFVAAEAGASGGMNVDLAAGDGADRSDPACQIGQHGTGLLWTECIGINGPGLLPAGNVARLIAGDPGPETQPDEPLRLLKPGESRGRCRNASGAQPRGLLAK